MADDWENKPEAVIGGSIALGLSISCTSGLLVREME